MKKQDRIDDLTEYINIVKTNILFHEQNISRIKESLIHHEKGLEVDKSYLATLERQLNDMLVSY